MFLEINKLGYDKIKRVYICGGTLVASKYIISAAHCVFDDLGGLVKESDIKVRISDKFLKSHCQAYFLHIGLRFLRQCVYDYTERVYWKPPILVPFCLRFITTYLGFIFLCIHFKLGHTRRTQQEKEG